MDTENTCQAQTETFKVGKNIFTVDLKSEAKYCGSRSGPMNDDYGIRTWRPTGSRNRLYLVLNINLNQPESVMVWRGIIYGTRTPVIIVPRTITGKNIVLGVVRLFRSSIGNYFVFRDDIAPAHRTLAVLCGLAT